MFGLWVCGQAFTILAQLALVFLLVFPVGLALRPRRAAAVSAAVALAAGLALAAAFPGVGAATCAAFAVPLAFGLAAAILAHGVIPR